ncbi:hypothetical protein APS56_07690 [Pseudalgibacter alginicilyticus]|uniref:Secretion system C-terminal sorting domain-containing protein n=1 Tax=Pseudalgibacter alginicilyticus TaxID=1736674 RepID=A0A0P0CFR7_9FLAO|nr:T9SS type A sorting domain-containing protein [Pseudalgibacter alginicilyticus]ALJ05012.1 hypothetical protein APS56_07690 [Pseudalgibacter alginicilyticus]
MKSNQYLLTLSVLLLFNIIYSQTGPGGVGNNTSNGLWLTADNLPLTNNDFVDTWFDASGNNNHAFAITDEQPIYLATSSLNNMPCIRMDGYNDQLEINDANILDGTIGMTLFTILRPNNLNGNPRGILGKRITHTTDVDYAYTWFFHNNNYINVDINTNNNRFNTQPTGFSNATNYLLEMSFDGSLLNHQRSKVYSAGKLITENYEYSNTIINSASNLTIGVLPGNNSSYFGADIAELIHYNYTLNNAEQIIVNNYLSAKYNINLDSDDIYQQDNPVNGDFDHNVAGIGQASDGSQHTDSQGSGIVRISHPSSLSNNEFLFWGEETKIKNYNFSSNSSNYSEQLNSRWQISSLGNLGSVTVAFDISSMNLSGINTSCSYLQLVIDNDYNFTSPESVYNLNINASETKAQTITAAIFNSNDYFTLRYIDKIVWDGFNFFNGSVSGTNAPNTYDSCLKLVIKAGTPATLTENAHVREIEIESGATLNVAEGILLEVENGIKNNGSINLFTEAQLIQNHIGSNFNTGTGTTTVKQQGTGNSFSYNYWSSPVNTSNDTWQIVNLEDTNGVIPFIYGAYAADHTTSPITLSSRWLYTFNGPDDYNTWKQIGINTNIAPGIGYTMKGSGSGTNQEYIFRGKLNNGDYTTPIIAPGNQILIGNPYPSALDADKFIAENIGVIDAIYFWESFAGNNSHYLANYEGGYATRNIMMGTHATIDTSGLTSGENTAGITKPEPTQFISVGQGFFVESTAHTDATLNFNNGQRAFAKNSNNSTIFYKNSNTKNQQVTSEDTRPKLWFSVIDPKGYKKTIGLGYDTNTTLQYDRAYDTEPLNYLKDFLYWTLESKKLVIQALPEININDILPLVMEVSSPGLFEFSISKMENIPDNLNIYLLDNQQNVYYSLRDSVAQLLLNTKGTQNQFSIVFQKQNTLGAIEFNNNAFISYNANLKTLKLYYNKPISNIKNLSFYNTLGQEVKRIKAPSSNFINISQLNDGVYILKVETKSGTLLRSIKFVKY